MRWRGCGETSDGYERAACPVADPFAAADQAYATITEFLRSEEAWQVQDSELERQLEGMGRELMRKSRFTDEQMVGIVREADRDAVGEVAKRRAISEQTIYTWRKRFGGFQANDVRRLKQLEAENVRLKKLVAERDLEIEVMKEVAAKNW